MTDWLQRVRLHPFKHQIEDAVTLSKSPHLFICSEMRTGKSKVVIDAAQILFSEGVIDKVLVIAPAPVRDVWYHEQFGELHKHLWNDLPSMVMEFHSRTRGWAHGPAAPKRLEWVITNFEFLRNDARLDEVKFFCTKKTLLVLDESSFVKNHAAQQTMACVTLRWLCGRVVLLNGTPISHSPLDLFSQGNLLHPKILDCRFITHFKARYTTQQLLTSKKDGKPLLSKNKKIEIKQIIGYTNLDDLQRRFAPYVIRRLQKDCLDLPPKLDPVTLTKDLTPSTWKIYREMRDDLVVWLRDNRLATAATAAIKVLRLAQITSGFLGGIEEGDDDSAEVLPGFFESLDLGTDFPAMPLFDTAPIGQLLHQPVETTREIGREKLDVLLWFIGERLAENRTMHMVAWSRFRPELARMMREVAAKYPELELGEIRGQQKPKDRTDAMRLLHPDTSPKDKPVFVGGTYGTGSFGVNFTAANISFNVSFDYSLGKFLQAKERVYGPGQVSPVAYYDLIAVGPKGQKTIDHHIVEARRNHADIATWTTDAWVTKLLDE